MVATAARAPIPATRDKPPLTFWQIWNLCFGFLGIQFGFALQNANVSRIFQTLGAEMELLPLLWIAAPLTGLIVQPVVGYYSDRTWNRLGRRRPYFLFGALLTTLALFAMPNAPYLWIAAGTLWIMDASINIAMEPFRAFVADQMPPHQRPAGYAMQGFFIGSGAVIASALPWLLTHFGVANTASSGVPDNVRYAFYLGGAVLFAAVGWTVLSSKEYPPDELLAFSDARQIETSRLDRAAAHRRGLAWLAAGLAGLGLIAWRDWDRQLYLLATGVALYGASLLYLARHEAHNLFTSIMADLHGMPAAMRRLAVVQFFSWFALFSMWIYTTAAVAAVHFGSSDPASAAYNRGADWVGVLFAVYNGFAALAALAIPQIVRRLGLRLCHLVNLWLGAAGLISFLVISDPNWLLLSMLGVGFAWASILSLPYALLADHLPAAKMGTYMGIFNFFIVIPQLAAAGLLGWLLKTFFAGTPIAALAIGSASLFIAGLSVLRLTEAPAETGHE